MPAPLDLTGRTFGRLTALARAGRRGRAVLWQCACACGRETLATTGNLTSGASTSCGCKRRESVRQLGLANRKAVKARRKSKAKRSRHVCPVCGRAFDGPRNAKYDTLTCKRNAHRRAAAARKAAAQFAKLAADITARSRHE